MSDTIRLSGIAAKQLAGAGQRNGHRGIDLSVNRNFSASAIGKAVWTTAIRSNAPRRS